MPRRFENPTQEQLAAIDLDALKYYHGMSDAQYLDKLQHTPWLLILMQQHMRHGGNDPGLSAEPSDASHRQYSPNSPSPSPQRSTSRTQTEASPLRAHDEAQIQQLEAQARSLQ